MLIAAAIGMRCYADAVRTPAEFDFTHFETTIMQVLHLSRLLDPTAAPVAVICYVLYLYPKGHRYGAHSTTTQCMLFDARNSDDVIASNRPNWIAAMKSGNQSGDYSWLPKQLRKGSQGTSIYGST